MTPTTSLVRALQDRLRLTFLNRLTYPQTLLGVGRERLLTEAEVQKAVECLDACVRFVDAEFTLLAARLEEEERKK